MSIDEIQAAYYMVAATGVLVAAAYYVMNIISSNKQRKTEIVRDIIDRHSSYDHMKYFMTAANLEYSDYDDFVARYGGKDNEGYILVNTMWAYHDRLGYLLKEGYVTPDSLFNLGGWSVYFLWMKFEPLDVAWKRLYGETYMPYVKYLALEMVKVKKAREPGFQIPEQMSKYI